MITIIDYGIGNLRSIEKAFEHVSSGVIRTDDPEIIQQADRLVLPGVGAFGACIHEVRQRQLEQPIFDAIARKVPFLGVCVGMQMLFESSSEKGQHTGLGLLEGHVKELKPEDSALKVPHMGWNMISPVRATPLLNGLPENAYCYFAHSFYATKANPNDVIATTEYGSSLPVAFARDNIYGVQFHPEKSHEVGLQILSNFGELRA
ncbi:MAG: imidazole glycerol phosphate synthase subunit HisH [Bacteroidetes bacterium]|nr:imidazole glycerol phosphate synthase subunit HisH [Bacteroidota bacterium]MCY4204824.1 imidazole glycerol phosphate synthase subunit HisH [Bacteroidota bacterium]